MKYRQALLIAAAVISVFLYGQDCEKAEGPVTGKVCGEVAADLGKSPLLEAAPPAEANELYFKVFSNQVPPPALPEAFAGHALVLVYAGEYRHAGYKLEVEEKGFSRGELVLTAGVKEDTSNTFHAQVITRPYCLLAVNPQKVDTVRLETDLDFGRSKVAIE